jgi:hypothetical protein
MGESVMPRVNAESFDLMARLESRATQMPQVKCDKEFSFYSMPVYILENVQHFAERFKTTKGIRSTENDVIDSLMHHGLELFERDPDIKLWRSLRESVIGIEPKAWRDTEDYELVRAMMDDIKTGLNPCGRELTKKRNVKLLGSTVEGTSKLASSIGFGKSIYLVGILLLMRGQIALGKDAVFNHDVMQVDLEKLNAKLRKRTRYLVNALGIADVELGEDVRAILTQYGQHHRQGASSIWRANATLLPVTG